LTRWPCATRGPTVRWTRICTTRKGCRRRRSARTRGDLMTTTERATLPYRNASLTPEARTADLLSRMTLEEKAAQMVGVWQLKSTTLVDDAGNFDVAKARAAFGHGN